MKAKIDKKIVGLVGIVAIVVSAILISLLPTTDQESSSGIVYGISESEALDIARVKLENEGVTIPENATAKVTETVNEDTGLPEIWVEYSWTEIIPEQTIEIGGNMTEHIPEIEIPRIMMVVIDKETGETEDILVST